MDKIAKKTMLAHSVQVVYSSSKVDTKVINASLSQQKPNCCWDSRSYCVCLQSWKFYCLSLVPLSVCDAIQCD